MKSSSTDTRFNLEKRDWVDDRTLVLIAFAGAFAVVLSLVAPSFLTADTFFTQSRFISLYILVALAQAICLVTRGMNLTVGALGGLTTVIFGLCLDQKSADMPVWAAVAIALLFGAAIGLFHGLVITRFKIDCFLVTLSMMFVYLGLRSGISGGNPYTVPPSFLWLGQDAVADMISKVFRVDRGGGWLWSFLDSIPLMFVLVILILAATSYMFNFTVVGRRILATGSNPDAARLSGINTARMIVWTHIISGSFIALAAVIYASWNGNAAPATGDDWMIISFAVAIIGGTGLSGSLISGSGILLGAIIFKMIQHSLVIVKVNDNYSNTVLGGLILLVILIDRLRKHLDKSR
jgi:ribose transport system permease protein